MKDSVKLLSLFTITFFIYGSLQSQFVFKPGSNIIIDIKKVVEDYPNRFANITGKLILQNPQSAEYECNFKVNNAEESSITIYSADNKIICSWQALILSTDNFQEAKSKYKNIYNQLNNQAISMEGTGNFHLKGVYREPKEENKFSVSLFTINPMNENIKKLRVEVSLQYELMEWKLRVLVYDKEKEDDERGRLIDN